MNLARRFRILMVPLVAAAAAGCAGTAAQDPAAKPVATASAAPSSAPAPAPMPGPETASSATLVVHGMGCPLCANNVDKQLLKVPGVEKVNVDLGSGKVKVSFAPGSFRPGDARLAKAVANSGYTLVRIQTP